jgi:hypothetical protein
MQIEYFLRSYIRDIPEDVLQRPKHVKYRKLQRKIDVTQQFKYVL